MSLLPRLRAEYDYLFEDGKVTYISKFFDHKDRLLGTVTTSSELDFPLLHGRQQLLFMKKLGLGKNAKMMNEDLAAYEWLLNQTMGIKQAYLKERDEKAIRPADFRRKYSIIGG